MPGAQKKRDATARQGRHRNQAGPSADPPGAQAGPSAGRSGTQHESYDGPGSNAGESRGRPASNAGTRSSSRPGSQVRGSSQTRRNVDPARDPVQPVLSKNVDFGGGAYNIFDQVSPHGTVLV